jgi:hypothetical protein
MSPREPERRKNQGPNELAAPLTMIRFPDKRPTPGEYAVIAVVISGALIVLGSVALIAAFRAPPEKHEIAAALAHRGSWSLGIGLFIAFAFWLVRRFTARYEAGQLIRPPAFLIS